MRRASGGRIDRGRTLRFRFDGVELSGHPGDTLASALLANGVHLVGRSFKYHRPRGILGAGVEEPNALVGVTRGPGRFDPNNRATQVELVDGLDVESQNRWPSLARDLGAVNDLASSFLPAGFYYKTFMWPPGAWEKLYEPRIRAMAGLGRAPAAPDPDRYAHRFAHCELLIVGAGPAGLAAALAAAPSGRRIILCDLDSEVGGSLLAAPDAVIDGLAAGDWLAAALATLAAAPNVRLLPRTAAIHYGIGNFVTLAERCTDHLPPAGARGPRERLWMVRARHVLLATGAIERPLLFPGNDRPGVMLASATVAYAQRWGVLAGRRALLFASHDSGWHAALALAAAGMAVAAIVDRRAEVRADLREDARAAGIETLVGHAVAGSRGRLRVSADGVAPVVDGAVGAPTRWIDCDLLPMAGGWTPSIQLFSQSRGTARWDATLDAFVPGQSVQAQTSVGAARGSYGLADCLAEGWRAGGGDGPAPAAAPTPPDRGDARPLAFTDRRAQKAFVDFQNDVTARDIGLALREGFESVEHLKRYTTTGMATDQGRTSNMNALGLAAQALDRPIEAVGLTTFRAPSIPTTFAAFAGPSRSAFFEPVRLTPSHAWASARGAVFEDVGQWKRARYFPENREDMAAAVARECLAVRAGAGMFDASTLGKIEIVGPDAAAFVDMMYTNPMAKLGVGRCRYGVMLREDGFILDDGIVARLAPDRFHVTTTTGGAAGVLNLMEDFRQTELPQLRVWLTSITEQWSVVVVTGPIARDIVAPLVEGPDISNAAMPHLSVREAVIAGHPGRLFRVSFTGELGYELNVPASAGAALWEAVAQAGAAHGVVPYGTESMHVLRAEKGYIIVGQETDGTVTPDDAGLGWAVGAKKPDFVGKRSLGRPAFLEPGRKQLVGLVPVDGVSLVEEGAQLVDAGAPPDGAGAYKLVLRQRRLRPPDCACAPERRPRPDRRDGRGRDAGRPGADAGGGAAVRRPRRQPARWLSGCSRRPESWRAGSPRSRLRCSTPPPPTSSRSGSPARC
jgi:sarcosine oxidase subunit alpha